MTSNHEEAKAILLVYLELEFLVQLLVAAQQWSQFHRIVWLSLHMLCHWNTVSNFASLTSAAGVRGFAAVGSCLHWLHHGSFLWFFPSFLPNT